MGGYHARGAKAGLACDKIPLSKRPGLPGRSARRYVAAGQRGDKGPQPDPPHEWKRSVPVWLLAGVLALALLTGLVWSVSGLLTDRFRPGSAGASARSADAGRLDASGAVATQRAGAPLMEWWSGIWTRHGGEIIAIHVLVVGQSAAIAGLLFERRRRRSAELAARQRLAEVADLDRVASAGVLSTSIAHELNQPLGAILSNAEAAEIALQSAVPDLGMCKETLGDIRRDVRRAADILGHLRGLLKQAPFEVRVVDVNDAVCAVMEVIAAEAKRRGVTLNPCLLARELPVRADLVHLQQAFLNAALNAFDAMDQTPCHRRHLTFRTALATKSEVWVSVADRGTGIPSEQLKRIFDRSYTTKVRGMGLGLSIARTIVETYGGRMWAENRRSGGAAIRFSLPLASGAGVGADTKVTKMPQRPGAPATIS
jgi:signal transduction histidine kinase